MTLQEYPDALIETATPQVPGAPLVRSRHPETQALHGGSFRYDPTTCAVAVPIDQTTSYQLPGTAGADT